MSLIFLEGGTFVNGILNTLGNFSECLMYMYLVMPTFGGAIAFRIGKIGRGF
jgi:hypothetical protein